MSINISKILVNKLIFIITFICFNGIFLSANSQSLTDDDSECIVCTQVVPDCSENEELVLQTCEACAHCKPKESDKKEDCQKCKLHAECEEGYACINDCCIPKMQIYLKKLEKEEKENLLKKKVRNKLLKMFKNSNNDNCKNPCGLKCCNKNEICITIDQCQGEAGKCKLPILKYCASKIPEGLNGREKTFKKMI